MLKERRENGPSESEVNTMTSVTILTNGRRPESAYHWGVSAYLWSLVLDVELAADGEG